jgi:hypothetical protein
MQPDEALQSRRHQIFAVDIASSIAIKMNEPLPAPLNPGGQSRYPHDPLLPKHKTTRHD